MVGFSWAADRDGAMKKARIGCSIPILVVLAVILWAALSSNPLAQGFRQLLGRKPDQPVLNSSFQIPPRGFRYYKFTLPQASKHMALVGHFSAFPAAAAEPPGTGSDAPRSGSLIEVLLLNESAFQSWERGEPAPSVYDSSKVSQENVDQVLPAGPGLYYLVFSNRFDVASAKKINASLTLHSTGWVAY
jgi:hypothetical protein